MQLKPEEKIKLVLEAVLVGLLTLFLIFALFQSVIFLFRQMPDEILDSVIVQEIIYSASRPRSVFVEFFTIVLIVLIVSLTILWRLSRRRRRFEIRNIIEGIVIIANGNYDYRIQGTQSEDLQNVVDSIHFLVDSTIESMEEEKRLEASKEELITNVSHDLRTPLTAIIGYLGLLETKQYHSQEDMEKYISIAYQKSLHMQSLVNDLFEYTQVSQSENSYEAHTFDLLQLMEQLVAEFELEAKEHEMEIQVQSNRSAVYMKGDPERLVRVFTNIISNAFKYGSNGNEIRINIQKNRQNIFITIANNGKAISKKATKDIFERFYRDEKSRTDQSGSGLGLSIAKNIVEKHGGKISADVIDGWTTFKIILPIRGCLEEEK